MNVKLKRLHKDAVLPKKANKTDAAFDFTAVTETIDPMTRTFTYTLGWAIEIPEGHVGMLFPRSSILTKDISLGNAVGIIDSGFRGEMTAKFKPQITRAKKYDVGDRVVQLLIMPIPEVEFVEVKELSASDRGEKGWGSSGK